MGSAIDNFIEVMLEMAKEVKAKADLLFRDLIEPSDLYLKHYSATNSTLIEQATEIWKSLHQARTQMLFSKENYFNQMHQLTELQRQLAQEPDSPQASLVAPAVQAKISHSELSTRQAEQEYKGHIKLVNKLVDQIRNEYRNRLNRIQENDDSQINFMKFNMQKFS